MGFLKRFKRLFGRPKKDLVAQRVKPRYRKPKPCLKWAKYDGSRKKVRLTVRLPESYVIKYKTLCKRLNISCSDMVLWHIREDLHKASMGQLAQRIRVRARKH